MNKDTKIALTVSQHFDEVYPDLAEVIDAVELRNFNNVPSAAGIGKIAHLNGFIDSGFDKFIEPDFLEYLNSYCVDLFSFDLGPSCEHIKMQEFYKAQGPVLGPEEIIRIGREKINKIRSCYSGGISLENMDYHEGGAYEYVCEPEFIKRAIEELDTGLTLDIGHLNVTCFHMGMAPLDYMRLLPMNRLKEVHISHSEDADDNHAVPTDADYTFLDSIFSLAKPEYMILECYQDPETIKREIRRLYKWIKK